MIGADPANSGIPVGDIEVGSSTKRVKMDMSAENSKDTFGSTDLGLGRVRKICVLDTEELPVRVLILDHGIPSECGGVAEQSSDDSHGVPLLKIVKTSALMSALQTYFILIVVVVDFLNICLTICLIQKNYKNHTGCYDLFYY
jgi:hypothetical protein